MPERSERERGARAMVGRLLRVPVFVKVMGASAAVVMRSHFGASSICASALRISSLRSPFARGMDEVILNFSRFYA